MAKASGTSLGRRGLRAALLTVGLAAFAVGGCGLKLEKMPEADVDAAQKATAESLAKRIYEGCRDARFEPLREDEAIPEMRDGLDPARQKSTCAAIQGQFGDFTSMDYAETWRQRGLRIYRFKGHFSKSETTPEIRVVMDGSNKLSGFWLKPWSDDLR